LNIDPQHELDQIRRERDLYLRLLELGALTQIESFLGESLKLVVELTGAQNGYLELRDPRDTAENDGWYLSHGFSPPELEDVRTRISRGIVAEVLATGKTIDTPSAILDPRFSGRGSVRAMRIEAVLCIPIGQDPPLGALYLQGREQPGPFETAERQRAEIFCHHLARLADSLILRLKVEGSPDPTQAWRQTLRLDGIVGRSAALATLLRQVSQVSPLEVSVLLIGESGTGKSKMARVIHENGPRAAHPFVEVNCATIPQMLIERELFGAVPGSLSGDTAKEIPGKVAGSERGTLFLDEVNELPLIAQSKLLQLLQSKQYTPLGSSDPRNADVRVIVATNTNLEAAVKRGQFREDLFYRLQVLPVRVPGLTERRDDIPELAQHFCRAAAARDGLPALELSRAAIYALASAEWPGHVNQLIQTVEGALIRAATDHASGIGREHVFPSLESASGEPAEPGTFQQETRRFQARLLRETLESVGWNIAEAARRLDLARSHVYTLIKAFGLEREPGKR
jgi:Nif-specific regulatory protein